MVFFKKHSFEAFAITAILILFIFTRFYNILSLPIFTDEAIYVRWAQIAKQDASWRFISLTDGKQPLFIWVVMVLMRFISDPLLAGRTASVCAGLATMFGIFFLGREVFKNIWIGILSSFLYLLFPMALLYDRMALYDSLVGTFAIWGLYFAILFVRKVQLDFALILGMVTGMAALNKTNGFFTLYLLPFSLLIFDWKHNAKIKLLKWLALSLVVAVFTYAYYSILRLSPFFHIIEEKNALFIYPFKEWIKHPFDYFFSNLLIGQWDWFITYITWPVLILIIASFFIAKIYFREKLLLFIWFVIPFLASALFGKTIYPRFIFFMTLSLLPLAAYTLCVLYGVIKNRLVYAVMFTLTISLFLRTDFLMLTDFKSSTIHYSDLNQYNNDWPSGAGVRESIELFKEQAEKEKIFLATQGTFGLMPAAYEIYLLEHKNITIKGFWPITETLPQELVETSKKMPVYFVFYQACTVCPDKGHAPDGWLDKVRPVLEITKASGKAYLTVYKIQP